MVATRGAFPSLAATATRTVALPVPLEGAETVAHAASLVADHAQSARLAVSVRVAEPACADTVCLAGASVAVHPPLCAPARPAVNKTAIQNKQARIGDFMGRVYTHPLPAETAVREAV
jgi:hypothetical protein